VVKTTKSLPPIPVVRARLESNSADWLNTRRLALNNRVALAPSPTL